MTSENKKRIANIVMYIVHIVYQSLFDIPKALILMAFLFLIFAPASAWIEINQIWYNLRPLTDHGAVMLGKCVSYLLQLAWIVAASVRLVLSIDKIFPQMKEVKNDR